MWRYFNRESARWWKRAWQLAGLCITVALTVFVLVPRARAFKIGVHILGWPAVHEEITADAISSVLPQPNPLMVNNIQSGVYNTDLSHQLVNAFHFDNSTTANGGFENGFATLHGMLGLALSEAQTCTPGPVNTPSASPPQSSSTQVQVVFPFSKSQEDPIHGVGYMHTDVGISRNGDGSGQLAATTHTWSAKDLEGFHGSVAAVLLDQNQRLLWVSQTQTYGVDGKHVPFSHGPSDRTDKWNDVVPAQVLERARYMAIKQKWSPKPVTFDDIRNWLQGVDVANELRSLLQTVETVVTQTGGNSTHGATAVGNCTMNPLFLNPQHGSYRDLIEDIAGTYFDLSVNGGCLEELACPTDDFAAGAASVQVDALPTLLDTDPDPDEVAAFTFAGGSLSIPVPNFAGMVAEVKTKLDSILGGHCRPDWTAWPGNNPVCFDRLEDMAPGDNDFQLLAGHLRILQYEYQAYYAWQHLGHALHTTQDFFAHSNYVELAAGHRGPPCTPGSYEASTICDSPLSDSAPTGQLMTKVPLGAIPLPTDGHFPWSLGQFRNVFDTSAVAKVLDADPSRRIFSDSNSLHLQTGYFPCIPGAGNTPHDDGFPYCHTATQSVTSSGSAGMNKDEPYASGGELNLQNHNWARHSATRLSVALFGAFMGTLPNSGSLLSTNMAVNAANPGGAIVWQASQPLQASKMAIANAGVLNVGHASPAPQQIRSFKSQKPAEAAPRIVPFAVVQRNLPAITRPELLQPIQKPHIYVKLFPNRAFHPGEQVALTVEAFDAKTGAPLRGLPAVVGDARGVTGKPISLTVKLTTTRRCSSAAGQSFCLNVLTPPSGSVGPAGNYPAASFTLSAVMPRLLVNVAGGKAIQRGTPFTVNAVDARTHQPVAGAQVLRVGMPSQNVFAAQKTALTETAVAVANRPASYALEEIAPLQPKRRIGSETRTETLSASFGPPLIVRAPGYSDEFVHYVIAKGNLSIRQPGTGVRP